MSADEASRSQREWAAHDFVSTKPEYCPKRQTLRMRFKNNRVKLSSSKNYMLRHKAQYKVQPPAPAGPACESDNDFDPATKELVLQFGKQASGQYTLDFMPPLTPLHAFAIGLATFANHQ